MLTSDTMESGSSSGSTNLWMEMLSREAEAEADAKRRRPRCLQPSEAKHVSSEQYLQEVVHIRRERQRREDMTTKFQVLESLLPGDGQRDRTRIVEDSVTYMKNLQRRIKSLRKRKVELKQTVAAAARAAVCCEHATYLRRKRPFAALQAPSSSSAAPQIRWTPVSDEELSRIQAILSCCLKRMEVHVDLPHPLVFEMVCHPQPRLQSNILQCLESLNLEVMECTISTIAHRLICVITAMPQGATAPTSHIVAVLESLNLKVYDSA